MSKPLMDKSKYIEDLRKIDDNYKIMNSMRPLPKSGVDYFVKEFSISTAHSSNAIEGNTFTYDETRLLLEKGIESGAHSFREKMDIVGYKQGFNLLYTALKNGRKIDEEFIKELHTYVLFGDEEAGKYRTIQNYIGNLSRVVYTPCSPKYVPEEMAKYVEKLNADFQNNQERLKDNDIDWNSLFHNLAEHHIAFERIHPFIDGNGRTGRLLLTYEMISLGLLPVDIRYEERKRYEAGFSSYHDKEKYSSRAESKTEKMAQLLAECELKSMELWNKTFEEYKQDSSEQRAKAGAGLGKELKAKKAQKKAEERRASVEEYKRTTEQTHAPNSAGKDENGR